MYKYPVKKSFYFENCKADTTCTLYVDGRTDRWTAVKQYAPDF